MRGCALLFVWTLIFPACDSSTLSRASRDQRLPDSLDVRDSGTGADADADAKPDGPVASLDGPVASPDGPVASPDGPVASPDGSLDATADAAIPDATADAPIPDAAADAPIPDAPIPDAPIPDAPLAADGPISTPDQGGNDFAPVQNDAGKYMCKDANGALVLCECNNGVDDNGKNGTDTDDPCCSGPSDNTESGGDTQCSDCIDNDKDGKPDAADPDCTGRLDDSESHLGTDIPGDNTNCKQDCFFDGDSGSGNDGCHWNLYCDPREPSKHILSPQPQTKCFPHDETLLGTTDCPWDDGTGTCSVCKQTQLCLDTCLPITPNGCDCFGCCAIPVAGGGTETVLLRDTCKANADGTIDPFQDNNNDNKRDCPPCTQVQDCLNTCGLCEVCIGKPAPDPSCLSTDAGAGDAGGSDGPTASPCGSDTEYCGPGGIDPSACPVGSYCITGCCIYDGDG